MLVRALVATEMASWARRVEGLLDGRQAAVVPRDPSRSVKEQVQEDDVDLVVADASAAGRTSLAAWAATIRRMPEPPELVLLQDGEDARLRAALLAAGVLAVLDVRLSDAELRRTLQALLRRPHDSAAARIEADRSARAHALGRLVTRSRVMQDVVEMAERIAASDTSVLILGETGVGKERLARAVHHSGARAAGPFVPVNCGAIPEALLETELFGHERGAFTGAERVHRGHFELAHGGTLFLDEIGELPPHMQVKLLRALDDRAVQRLGSEERLPLDVRILAATNRDIETEVRAGRFRPDLYYRLAVVTLVIPPLRERTEDIPELVHTQLERFGPALGKPDIGIEDGALSAMTAYSWPGNVRELVNVIERAVLLARGPRVTRLDLPRVVAFAGEDGRGGRAQPTGTDLPPLRVARREAVDAFEREYLRGVLERTRGRVGEAARLAGVSERSLYDLMRRHGLRKEEYRRRGPDASRPTKGPSADATTPGGRARR